jgi:hypothetical protein
LFEPNALFATRERSFLEKEWRIRAEECRFQTSLRVIGAIAALADVRGSCYASTKRRDQV